MYVFLVPTITTLLIAIPIKKANMSNDFTIKYSHPHEGFWLGTIFVSPVHRVNIDKIHVNLCTTWLDIVFASPDRSRRSDGPYDPPGPFGEHLEVWFWRPIHLKRSQKIIIHYIVTLDASGSDLTISFTPWWKTQFVSKKNGCDDFSLWQFRVVV